jgi:hypothetical protein
MSKTPPGQRSLLPISSAAASPAKTSAQRAQETASKVLEAVFGTSSRELLKSFLPRGWSSKISVAQLIDGYMPSDLTWESEAMQAFRSRLEQKMQVHRTDEAEFSSWPTPVASESKRAKEDPRKRPNGHRNGRSLTSLTALWPTVVVTDEASSGRATTLANPENTMKPGTSLTDAMRAWATPTAVDSGRTTRRTKSKGGRDLVTDVLQWSTPKATDDKRGASPNRVNTRGVDRNLPTDVVNFRPGQPTSKDGESTSPRAVLNPAFCQALMGFPEGWLDVE